MYLCLDVLSPIPSTSIVESSSVERGCLISPSNASTGSSVSAIHSTVLAATPNSTTTRVSDIPGPHRPTPAVSYNSRRPEPTVSVVDISPVPSCSTDKGKKRKSGCTQAADLTSTPYKKLLEETPVNARREVARKKLAISAIGETVKSAKGKRLKANVSVPEPAIVSTTCEPSRDKVTAKFSVSDWVLVKYLINKHEKCFVGSITGSGETASWAIHFLKFKSRSASSFVDAFSASQDKDDVDEIDIIGRLLAPRIHRGIYKFEFDFSAFVLG